MRVFLAIHPRDTRRLEAEAASAYIVLARTTSAMAATAFGTARFGYLGSFPCAA